MAKLGLTEAQILEQLFASSDEDLGDIYRDSAEVSSSEYLDEESSQTKYSEQLFSSSRARSVNSKDQSEGSQAPLTPP